MQTEHQENVNCKDEAKENENFHQIRLKVLDMCLIVCLFVFVCLFEGKYTERDRAEFVYEALPVVWMSWTCNLCPNPSSMTL